MSDPFEQILSRRRFIGERLATLQKEMDALRGEDQELEVAERVYKRLSGDPAVAKGVIYRERPEDQEGEEAVGPNLPEMIFILLDEAKREGKRGLTSGEILKAIKARWRSDYTSDRVRPTLWRMEKKTHRLRKRGKFYSRPEEPAHTGDLLAEAAE